MRAQKTFPWLCFSHKTSHETFVIAWQSAMNRDLGTVQHFIDANKLLRFYKFISTKLRLYWWDFFLFWQFFLCVFFFELGDKWLSAFRRLQSFADATIYSTEITFSFVLMNWDFAETAVRNSKRWNCGLDFGPFLPIISNEFASALR